MPGKDLERAGYRQPFAPAVVLALLLTTCTQENVTEVVVASITVAPPTVSTFDGEQVTLAATVLDEDGNPVGGAQVTWSSDDRSVARIDVDGTAHAVGVGTTTVRASFKDVSGTATFVVLRAPSLAVSDDSVVIYAGAGGGPPAPAQLEVGNDGGGDVAHLGVEIVYPPAGPSDWLEVATAGSGLPTELTLSARPEGLSVGRYEAALVLTADAATNSPLSIPVILALTGLRVTETSGGTTVTETGGTDQFSVALAAQPAAGVDVDVVSTDPGEVRVSPVRLTFAPASWAQPQIVTVTGSDDPLLDGDQTSNVTLSSTIEPVASVVRVTTVDDDEADLTVIEAGGGTAVAESGTRDDVQVVLAAQPLSDVVLVVENGDPGEVAVSPALLRFTPAAWNEPQNVAVTGVDDDLIDGDQVTDVTLRIDASRSDAAFDALPARAMAVTTLDRDVASLSVAESGVGTTVTEGGTRDAFTIALGAGPPSDVVLSIVAEDATELVAEPATLRFTAANWRDPQTVLVRGMDDGDDDGDVSTFVRLAVDLAASHDAYDGLAPGAMRVTTTDNDGYGVTVIESEGSTLLSEAGGQDLITIVLDQSPWLSDVVVDITSTDPGEAAVVTTSVRFTPSDWSTPRTVTLMGVDDGVADGDQPVRIDVVVNDASSDFFYQFVPGRSVTAVSQDDDGAPGQGAPAGGSE